MYSKLPHLLNAIAISASVVLLLGNSLPGMVLRTAVVAPLYHAGLISGEEVRTLILFGHW